MSEQILVRVPATSANVGCLFDCAALALSLYLDLRVAPRADCDTTVRYFGVTPERVPTDSSNLVVRTIRETLAGWRRPRGFDLEIENQIPVGVGLGSSAAAIVGALATSYRLGELPVVEEELIARAARLEGHPDNIAAAWHGGFTLALEDGGRVRTFSSPVPDGLELVLVIPDYALPTQKARAVLPAEYSREHAVHNLQRAALLAATVASGKTEFDPSLFDDRIHQPFRAPLVPGLTEVLRFTHPDLLGLCLSGAGPSILSFVRKNGAAVGEALRKILAAKGVEARPCVVNADNRGAKGWITPATMP